MHAQAGARAPNRPTSGFGWLLVVVLLGLLLTSQLTIIDDVHDHFFGTDQDGLPIVTINAACQAFVYYNLSPSWVPKDIRDFAPRCCDPFNIEPLRLPATELTYPYTPPAWCESNTIGEASSYVTSTLLGWARKLDRYGQGDWLRHGARVVDDARVDMQSSCQALRLQLLDRHYRAIVVGAASALIIGIALVLVGTLFFHLLTLGIVGRVCRGAPTVYLMTWGFVFLLSALYYARLLDVGDLEREGRFDRRWATGTITITGLAIAWVWRFHGHLLQRFLPAILREILRL